MTYFKTINKWLLSRPLTFFSFEMQVKCNEIHIFQVKSIYFVWNQSILLKSNFFQQVEVSMNRKTKMVPGKVGECIFKPWKPQELLGPWGRPQTQNPCKLTSFAQLYSKFGLTIVYAPLTKSWIRPWSIYKNNTLHRWRHLTRKNPNWKIAPSWCGLITRMKRKVKYGGSVFTLLTFISWDGPVLFSAWKIPTIFETIAILGMYFLGFSHIN